MALRENVVRKIAKGAVNELLKQFLTNKLKSKKIRLLPVFILIFIIIFIMLTAFNKKNALDNECKFLTNGLDSLNKTYKIATDYLANKIVANNQMEEINYLICVNKNSRIPENWIDTVDFVRTTNSLGDDVVVEHKTYDAYLKLKSALESDNIYIDIDSSFRSIAEQADIVQRFTKKYGQDYVEQYVAAPGFSEHHTGLAIDLYLNVDGQDIYLNEDMIKYTDLWAKIHAKLSDYGFLLRFPEKKENITGYSYEPWHIRYIKDVEIAKEITEQNLALEEYLNLHIVKFGIDNNCDRQ